MERTDSTVIQVAPAYENAKIQEMQGFGWNLQGRQEIHEEGDAYGAPSLFSDSYVIKTKVHHYVKLHLVRPVALPNIDKIKSLENEYSSLPFPALPSLKGPTILTGFGVLAVLIGFASIGQPGSPGIGGLVVYFAILAAGVLWVRSRLAKKRAATEVCTSSLRRMEEIRASLPSLLR
jgi:hypothetical protein